MRPARVMQPSATTRWDDWVSSVERFGGSYGEGDGKTCDSHAAVVRNNERVLPTTSSLVRGEGAYIVAERLHAQCDPRAVDYWARAVAWTGEALREGKGTHSGSSCAPRVCTCRKSRTCRATQIRNSAMTRILACGQSYRRLDPSSHLRLQANEQTVHIPIIHHGFVWKRSDFQRLLVFESLAGSPGNVCGRGIPLVVLSATKSTAPRERRTCDGCPDSAETIRSCSSFVESQTPFAATAVMDIPIALFQSGAWIEDDFASGCQSGAVTLINPLVIDPDSHEGLDGGPPIAQCPAMPLDYAQQASQYNPLTAFLSGDNGIDRPRLRFLEPYQADKVPLIMVHGLLSDPDVFLHMVEAVRADPVLRKRYQIWVFRYPTGDHVLNSAAALREQLAEAFECQHTSACQSAEAGQHDLESCDTAAQRAVIVGHSMGGLLSRLQVTNSGDRLWQCIANVPIEQLQGSPQQLHRLRKSYYFQANPNIGRVVYIATPHHGSQWASRCIGRIGATLAGIWEPNREGYQEIVRDNPNAFSGDYSESFPSSVELLRPSNHLLQMLAAMPSSPSTTVHSIIGDSCWLPRSGASDGVVPVTSAYVANAESTTRVDASHSAILQSPRAQQILLEILRDHLTTPSTMATEPPVQMQLELLPAVP